MPEQVEKRVEYRVEYRVVGTNRDAGEDWAHGERDTLTAADRERRELSKYECNSNVRVQKSTVTVSRTPWEDVADV